MKSFFDIIEIVLPVFLLLVFGYIARRGNYIDEVFIDKGSRMVFKLLLPINIFNNIYKSSGMDNIDGRLVFIAFIFLSLVAVISYFLLGFLKHDGEERAIVMQILVRSNIVLFGLAIAGNYFPDEELSIVTMYISLIYIIANTYSVLIYELLLREKEDIKFGSILLSVLKNPILIAIALGMVFMFLNVRIYGPITKAMNDISAVATPLGLMCVGGSIGFSIDRADRNIIFHTLILKALLVPILGIGAAYILGLKGVEMFVIMIVLASPAAVSNHAMAVIYTKRDKLSAQLIFLSTITNSITIFLLIWFLSSKGIF